jgi:prepilin-type processing-associated H-X9-DG protein
VRVCTAVAAMTAWADSASSMHPGGLNVLMGDGSVRFVKDSVQSWPFNPLTGNPAGSSQKFGKRLRQPQVDTCNWGFHSAGCLTRP